MKTLGRHDDDVLDAQNAFCLFMFIRGIPRVFPEIVALLLVEPTGVKDDDQTERIVVLHVEQRRFVSTVVDDEFLENRDYQNSLQQELV